MRFPRSTVKRLPAAVVMCFAAAVCFAAACFTAVCFAAAGAAEPGMTFIPADEYARGRTHALPDDNLQWFPELLKDDRPVKKVSVSPFYLDTYEVTNEKYAKFVKATRHRAPYNWANGQLPSGKEKHPVAAIDWQDATAYCEWEGKRLPTEVEWERAVRGLTEGAKYPWGDRNPTRKDACYDTITGPCAVGQSPANGFGLFDMAGNVWEWCSDWYGQHYYAESPAKDPKGPSEGIYKVIRGGSWHDVPKYLTCSYRSWARPKERSPNIGVRCAQSFPR